MMPQQPEQPMMQPQQGPLPGTAAPPMQAPAQAPMAGGAAPPYRQLKVEDALAYLDQVKMKFEDKPEIYNQFLDIMKEFKAQSIDTPGVIERVLQLFHGHRMLILGFNTFLPPGYKIEFSDDQDKPRVQLKYPQGMTGPQPQPYVPPPSASALPVQQAPTHLTGITPAPYGQPLSGPGPEATPPPVPPTQAGSNAAQNTKKAPIEFDQAINYVTKIKKTFEDKPGTYRAFLEILHTYQKEQKSIKNVYEEVSCLFKDHPGLLAEFSSFLPDGSTKASLDSTPDDPPEYTPDDTLDDTLDDTEPVEAQSASRSICATKLRPPLGTQTDNANLFVHVNAYVELLGHVLGHVLMHGIFCWLQLGLRGYFCWL